MNKFFLRCSEEACQFRIHPWIITSCNQMSDEGQLQAVNVPDVLPSNIPKGPGLLSMCAGDFVVSVCHNAILCEEEAHSISISNF